MFRNKPRRISLTLTSYLHQPKVPSQISQTNTSTDQQSTPGDLTSSRVRRLRDVDSLVPSQDPDPIHRSVGSSFQDGTAAGDGDDVLLQLLLGGVSLGTSSSSSSGGGGFDETHVLGGFPSSGSSESLLLDSEDRGLGLGDLSSRIDLGSGGSSDLMDGLDADLDFAIPDDDGGGRSSGVGLFLHGFILVLLHLEFRLSLDPLGGGPGWSRSRGFGSGSRVTGGSAGGGSVVGEDRSGGGGGGRSRSSGGGGGSSGGDSLLFDLFGGLLRSLGLSVGDSLFWLGSCHGLSGEGRATEGRTK